MPSNRTRPCSLCSYEMHNRPEEENDVHQEAVSSCLLLVKSLVEYASCSYQVHNDPEEENSGQGEAKSLLPFVSHTSG
jgi:hypothetical protein